MEARDFSRVRLHGGEIIILIEGKLTEHGTTKHVSYLEHRNQMVRHIQGALNYIDRNGFDKKVIAFYIVPENFSEMAEITDRDHFSEILDRESVKICDEKERCRILQSYYGATTWEKVGEKLDIHFREVISRYPEKCRKI